MLIRKANKSDLILINDIYNQSVRKHYLTADIDLITIEDRRKWFNSHDENHPVYVAEVKDRIVGWISISPYRTGRRALRYTAEVSYYIDEEYQGKGIGSLLMDHAIKKSKEFGIKTLIAILLESNDASIRLLEKFSFEKWGHLPGVADFDGNEVGQYLFGRKVQSTE